MSESDEVPWSAPDTEVPAGRCGFELLPGDVGREERYDIGETAELAGWRDRWDTAVCCREVYEDGKCRWHADADEAAVRAAVAERDERATNLDGAVVRDVELDDGESFAECRFRGGTFERVQMREAEFPDADLSRAKFPDADLSRAKFPDAEFNWTEFPDADLSRAKFPNAEFNWTEFPDADLSRAKFPNAEFNWTEFPHADLSRAEFPDADLISAEFPDADLRDAEFSDADLRDAEFPDADLRDAEFPDADLHRADLSAASLPSATFTRTRATDTDLSETNLRNAQFHETELFQADFTRADARDAAFTTGDGSQPTNLEDAVLRETDLRGADLTDARLYEADLTAARTNRKTTIDTATVYERRPEMDGWFRDTTDAYGAAAWVHRRMERLHEENALSERARRFHIRKQEAEREGHKRRARQKFREWWNDSDESSEQPDDSDESDEQSDDSNSRTSPDENRGPLYHVNRYAALSLMYHLTRHGESLQQIGRVAGGIILTAGLLYPLSGGIASSEADTVHEFPMTAYYEATTLSAAVEFWLTDALHEFLWGIYFSIITFTTIGYGDLYPVGLWTKVLVGVESLAGAMLIALFVFVLGRRVAR